MKLKMDRFKVIIPLTVLLIASAIFYYFVFYLPRNENLRQAQTCQKLSIDYLKNLGYNIGDIGYKILFNQKMNTCLISVKSYDMEDNELTEYVVDILTNKTLLMSVTLSGGKKIVSGGLTENEFRTEEERLMSK